MKLAKYAGGGRVPYQMHLTKEGLKYIEIKDPERSDALICEMVFDELVDIRRLDLRTVAVEYIWKFNHFSPVGKAVIKNKDYSQHNLSTKARNEVALLHMEKDGWMLQNRNSLKLEKILAGHWISPSKGERFWDGSRYIEISNEGTKTQGTIEIKSVNEVNNWMEVNRCGEHCVDEKYEFSKDRMSYYDGLRYWYFAGDSNEP
jgi:hypothetical protein